MRGLLKESADLLNAGAEWNLSNADGVAYYVARTDIELGLTVLERIRSHNGEAFAKRCIRMKVSQPLVTLRFVRQVCARCIVD